MKVRKRNHLKYFASKDDLLAKLFQPILAEIKNNFFSNIDQQSDLTTLVRFIVPDRINFIENNFDFIRLIFQEILTGNLSDQHYHDLFSGNDGIIPKLNQLQKTFTEITQQLTAFQIARIFIGPILTYVLQNKLLGLPVDDSDLTLIQKQILANLALE